MAMLKRTVEVTGRGYHLSGQVKQLRVRRNQETLGSFPFEDLGMLVLDTTEATVTTSALVQAAQSGAITVLCGRDHLPVALVQPIAANALATQRLVAQTRLRPAFVSALWARVVRSKIRGQATILPKQCPGRARLLKLARDVKTGDRANHEAQAAKVYWQYLFAEVAPEFRRNRHLAGPNGLLNYGYAVVRAAMARALCVAGVHPSLGIQHSNRTNPFCLADDFMEPFRPLVDQAVRGLLQQGIQSVDAEARATLLGTLTTTIPMAGEEGPAAVAMQKLAQRFAELVLAENQAFNRPDSNPQRRPGAARRAQGLLLPWLA